MYTCGWEVAKFCLSMAWVVFMVIHIWLILICACPCVNVCIGAFVCVCVCERVCVSVYVGCVCVGACVCE